MDTLILRLWVWSYHHLNSTMKFRYLRSYISACWLLFRQSWYAFGSQKIKYMYMEKKKLKAKTDMWHMGNNLDNNLRGRFSFILGLYPAVVVWETRSFKMFIAEKWLLFDNYFWVIRSHPLCPCFFQTEVFWPWEAGVLGCFAQQARSGRHDVQLVKISQ